MGIGERGLDLNKAECDIARGAKAADKLYDLGVFLECLETKLAESVESEARLYAALDESRTKESETAALLAASRQGHEHCAQSYFVVKDELKHAESLIFWQRVALWGTAFLFCVAAILRS